MIRIGVISDTHSLSFEAWPKKLVSALSDVDIILHAGDLVTLVVLEGLKKICPEVYAVWGNMDPPEVKRALPDVQLIPIKQVKIGLTHGAGAPFNLIDTLKLRFKNKQVDCIVYGHSHFPRNEIHQGILYFNPGSPTDKTFTPYNSYGILEIGRKIAGRIIKI